MKKNNIKNICVLSFIILLLLISDFSVGYVVGRKSVKVKKITEIRWLRGETVRDTIYEPKPYVIVKNDTVVDVIYKLIKDTVALKDVLDDYYCEKKYLLDFSNDSIGEFKVDMGIKENSLIYANSEITPMIKIIKETNYIQKNKKVGFLVAVGTSLKFNTQKLEFGVLIKDKYMVGVTGIRLKKELNYTIDIGIKF